MDMVSSFSLEQGSESRLVKLEEKVRIIAIGTAIIANSALGSLLRIGATGDAA